MNPGSVPAVTVDELPADAVLLDCREDEEWQAGHIPQALHMPMNSIPTRLQFERAALPSDRPVVVVCAMGGRSAAVTAWLRAHGWDAVNLAGGMHAWADAGGPMQSTDGSPPHVL